jgi:disulfide bond formation protein DsbB
MIKKMLKQLKTVAHSYWYWLFYIVAGISTMAVALYHQHGLDEMPCMMCIHVRLWISLLIIVSVIGLLVRKNRVMNSLVHMSTVLIAIALTRKSYQLLGTERGFLVTECSFDLGLPDWFAIDAWLPWLYRVETTCGYTPEVLFGITMAEGLMVMSVCLLLVSTCVALASFSKPDN